MYILKKSPRTLGLDEPIRHDSHKRPTSRRDFIAQGFLTGPAVVTAGSLLSALLSRKAHGAMSPPLETYASDVCNISAGAGKVPFICFDLSGGANLLVHDTQLLAIIDGWIGQLPEEAFMGILPMLRRVFASIDRSERRHLLDRLRRPLSGDAGAPVAASGDAAAPGFAAALPLLLTILGLDNQERAA